MKKTTIKELAIMVAEKINEDVARFECENFKEMKRRFDWDAQQIRDEIDYTVNRELNAETGIAMMDDYHLVNFFNMDDEDNECTYGTFKKMVFANVK